MLLTYLFQGYCFPCGEGGCTARYFTHDALVQHQRRGNHDMTPSSPPTTVSMTSPPQTPRSSPPSRQAAYELPARRDSPHFTTAVSTEALPPTSFSAPSSPQASNMLRTPHSPTTTSFSAPSSPQVSHKLPTPRSPATTSRSAPTNSLSSRLEQAESLGNNLARSHS